MRSAEGDKISKRGLRNAKWEANDVHHPLKNCDDGRFVHIETLFQLRFKRGKFLSQLALVAEQCAHFQKRSNDKDGHLDRARAVENTREREPRG